jgi:hypothetical protein
VPLADRLEPRQPGRLGRQVWVAEDFDDLPADILAGFEAED